MIIIKQSIPIIVLKNVIYPSTLILNKNIYRKSFSINTRYLARINPYSANIDDTTSIIRDCNNNEEVNRYFITKVDTLDRSHANTMSVLHRNRATATDNATIEFMNNEIERTEAKYQADRRFLSEEQPRDVKDSAHLYGVDLREDETSEDNFSDLDLDSGYDSSEGLVRTESEGSVEPDNNENQIPETPSSHSSDPSVNSPSSPSSNSNVNSPTPNTNNNLGANVTSPITSSNDPVLNVNNTENLPIPSNNDPVLVNENNPEPLNKKRKNSFEEEIDHENKKQKLLEENIPESLNKKRKNSFDEDHENKKQKLAEEANSGLSSNTQDAENTNSGSCNDTEQSNSSNASTVVLDGVISVIKAITGDDSNED